MGPLCQSVLNNPQLIEYNTTKGLTCTLIASCYSARLSWALVLTWVGPFVHDQNVGVWVGMRVGFLATTFALKENYRPEDKGQTLYYHVCDIIHAVYVMLF